MSIERPVEKRFIFNGSAVAFAGRIRRPDDVFVKAAAGSHLPVTGGQAEIRLEGRDVEPYQYKNVITFTTAHTRALGDFSDPRKASDYTHSNHGENGLPANTVVQSRLEGLRIEAEADPAKQSPKRIFQTKVLDVHMESSSNRKDDEPISFRSLTVLFDGVSLASAALSPVELKVHTAPEVFIECDTKQKLVDRYRNDGEFRKKFAPCFHPPGAQMPGLISDIFRKHDLPHADRGPIVATFVTKLEWAGDTPEATEILNNRLTIAGLGRIYFGEIIVDEGMRRVTLLRFELGSRVGGDASACEVVANGTHWPPLSY